MFFIRKIIIYLFLKHNFLYYLNLYTKEYVTHFQHDIFNRQNDLQKSVITCIRKELNYVCKKNAVM